VRDRESGHAGNEQFYTLTSWLVERTQAPATIKALSAVLKSDPAYRGLMDASGHIDCCYFGELGWLDVPCPHRQADSLPLIAQGEISVRGFTATEEYFWEGSIWDCSIEEGARAVLPSTYLQRSGDLHWSGSTRSWLSGDDPVIVNIDLETKRADVSMLAVREDWLRGFLAARDMAVVYGVRGERRNLEHAREEYRWLEFALSGAYGDEKLLPGQSEIALKSNQPRKRR
jgi:hypothetical protein